MVPFFHPPCGGERKKISGEGQGEAHGVTEPDSGSHDIGGHGPADDMCHALGNRVTTVAVCHGPQDHEAANDGNDTHNLDKQDDGLGSGSHFRATRPVILDGRGVRGSEERTQIRTYGGRRGDQATRNRQPHHDAFRVNVRIASPHLPETPQGDEHIVNTDDIRRAEYHLQDWRQTAHHIGEHGNEIHGGVLL